MHRSTILTRSFAGVLASLIAASALAATPPSDRRFLGYADATATQTFATTSYADLAAATVTFTPTIDPTIAEAGPVTHVERVHVEWSADASKATSTTGSCAIYVNGAVVANTERFISTASGRGSISGQLDVTLTGAASQVAKLQCRSGDTAVFTVNNASIFVEERYR